MTDDTIIHVVTRNCLEAEGEIELIGLFKTIESARKARRRFALEAKEIQGTRVSDRDDRWDLCGDLVVYEIHSGRILP